MASDYKGYQGPPQGTTQMPIPIPASPIPQPVVHNEDLPSKIANVIQNHFDLKNKDQAYMHRHLYPKSFDHVPLPNRYRLPNFSKFSSQDNVSSIEHVS
jgi:hypothetical protein